MRKGLGFVKTIRDGRFFMKKIKKALLFAILCVMAACLFACGSAAPMPPSNVGTLHSITNAAI